MPSCEEEVLRIRKKLDKMVEGNKEMDAAEELIEALTELPVTMDILTKTRIGVTINDLRKKATDEKISKKAKSLIKRWKALLESKSSPSTPNSKKRKDSDYADSNSPADSQQSKESESRTAHVPKANGLSASGDEVRQKTVEVLINALKSAALPDGTHDPEEIATRVEEKLFEVHRGTGPKYTAAVRSRIFNLRDKKNPALRENVLTGAINPAIFAEMKAEEMASSEMKQMREKFNKEAIDEHQMAVNQGTPSDMFKCGKCGKRNCTYNQMQTRSADEPMTTFVFCRECGNRWKFC